MTKIIICPHCGKEIINSRNTKSKLTLEEAQENLKKELLPYKDKYGANMLNEFYRYWSEANPTKTKCKYQLRETWETAKRLANWYERSSGAK